MNLTLNTRIENKRIQTLYITQPNTIHLNYQQSIKTNTNCGKQLSGAKKSLPIFNNVPLFLSRRQMETINFIRLLAGCNNPIV